MRVGKIEADKLAVTIAGAVAATSGVFTETGGFYDYWNISGRWGLSCLGCLVTGCLLTITSFLGRTTLKLAMGGSQGRREGGAWVAEADIERHVHCFS